MLILPCGDKINPSALPHHLTRCGRCLAWWVSSNPPKKARDK